MYNAKTTNYSTWFSGANSVSNYYADVVYNLNGKQKLDVVALPHHATKHGTTPYFVNKLINSKTKVIANVAYNGFIGSVPKSEIYKSPLDRAGCPSKTDGKYGNAGRLQCFNIWTANRILYSKASGKTPSSSTKAVIYYQNMLEAKKDVSSRSEILAFGFNKENRVASTGKIGITKVVYSYDKAMKTATAKKHY